MNKLTILHPFLHMGVKKHSDSKCVTIEKSIINRDGPRAPLAIYGPLDLLFLPLEKANAIADCLENQFTPHDLWRKLWTADGG
jgi:hypothetical protein